MDKARVKHIVEVCLLVLLTVGVFFAVQSVQHTYYFRPESVDAITTERSIPPEENERAQTVAETSESVSSTQMPTQPLPVIEYAPYEPSEVDPQNFRETIVLGNSQAQALANFGLLKNADFATKVGLSINQVLQSKSGNPPIRALYGKSYRKAVFVFGENELGWPYPKNFIAQYKKVIEKVRELNPGVKVFVQGIFPVSAESSAKNTNGVTNENVRVFNEYLQQMCTEIDAVFMPVSAAFFDDTGALPEGVAHDGVHFGYDYCKIWAGDLSAYLESEDELHTESAAQGEPTT